MAAPVRSGSIAPHPTNSSRRLSPEEICEKISKIEPLQMNLVALKIANHILKDLGLIALIEKKATIFKILWPIQKSLQSSLSTPDNFLKSGLYFDLSDSELRGILKQPAEKLGIKVTSLYVPFRYCIELTLDKFLTQQFSKLVFTLTKTNAGIELYQETFTIEQLVEDFGSSLKSRL